ncbi:MAG: relaxase/mobilization nuclease domain-containing protein [Flavobacteriaceae bacterium]|nr:relaxase/mobilization nuclease domain-containing protein [Flavobacteriaceae bacterium]
MVAKIGRGNHLKGVLIYNYEKVENDKGNVLFCNKMIEPLNNDFTISLLEKSFENYLIANQRTQKPILHISINPDPKDEVSDEQFQQMAEKYMNEMGYGNQPYVVFKHTDIARKHIHIAFGF